MSWPDASGFDQAGAIPYRRLGSRIQFCLISSIRNRRWIFPKGIIDPGETATETVLKEALEEAGVAGLIVGEPLGSYEHFKWGRTLRVIVALLEVTRVEDDWEEAALRERRWAEYDEASRLLSQKGLRNMLERARERLVTDEEC